MAGFRGSTKGGGCAAEAGTKLTVEVMSTEQTSQMYLTPPSLPRVAVFFLMTAMMADGGQSNHEIVRGLSNKLRDIWMDYGSDPQ